MIISLLIIISTVLIDYVTKLIASTKITLGEFVVVIPNILEFGHLTNEGASFGSLKGSQFLFMLITIFALAVFGVLLNYSKWSKDRWLYSLSVAFLIGGTFGNVIDRVFYDGKVIDFLHIPLLGKIHPIMNFTFNMADFFLTFAVVFMVIDVLFIEPKRARKESAELNE